MATELQVSEFDDDSGGIPLAPSMLHPPEGLAAGPSRPATLDSDEIDRGDAITLADHRIHESRSRPIPPDQGTLLKRAEEEDERRYAAVIAALEPRPPVWSVWIGSAGVTWLIVLIAALLSLFVLAQAALIVAQVESLPTFWRYVGYASAGILIAAFGLAAARLTFLYVRLRRSPSMRTGALQRLAARQWIRSDHVRRAFDHVHQSLRPLLADYPLDDQAAGRLHKWGADDTQIERLRTARTRLLPGDEGAEAWIEGFRARFLAVLDEVANSRIRQAAITAGKLTAISPRGAIDAIIVSALAIELVGDLCAIYNLKANRVETIQILGRVFLAAGIASEADDWTQAAAGSIFDSFHSDWLPGILVRTFEKLAAPITGALADGAVNAALLWRIGRRTIRAVRPLQ